MPRAWDLAARVKQLLDPLPIALVFVSFAIVSALVLVVVLGAVITLIVDLDRPRRGFLQVSQQPLVDLQEQIGPPSSS